MTQREPSENILRIHVMFERAVTQKIMSRKWNYLNWLFANDVTEMFFLHSDFISLFLKRERWKMFVNLSYIHRKRETNKSAHLTEWPCTATWHHLFVTLKYDNDICWWLILTLNENRPHWLAGLRSLTHSFTERYRMRGGVREGGKFSI